MEYTTYGQLCDLRCIKESYLWNIKSREDAWKDRYNSQYISTTRKGQYAKQRLIGTRRWHLKYKWMYVFIMYRKKYHKHIMKI